jgi:hypothetical protein
MGKVKKELQETLAPMSVLHRFYTEMNDNDLRMIYEGEFTQDITKSMLMVTEKNFDIDGLDSGVRKKVYNVMIESLQNICKHQYSSAENENGSPAAIFMSGMKGEDYFIITGNVVTNSIVEVLKERIDSINALDKEGLKELYRQKRLTSTISVAGGAGLGLIDMARKSGNKLVYRFDPYNETTSFFSLMSIISSKKD